MYKYRIIRGGGVLVFSAPDNDTARKQADGDALCMLINGQWVPVSDTQMNGANATESEQGAES